MIMTICVNDTERQIFQSNLVDLYGVYGNKLKLII